MTSAVNCRPLKEPPCFTATVRHRFAMGGFYLAVAAPKSCNRAKKPGCHFSFIEVQHFCRRCRLRALWDGRGAAPVTTGGAMSPKTALLAATTVVAAAIH